MCLIIKIRPQFAFAFFYTFFAQFAYFFLKIPKLFIIIQLQYKFILN